MKLNWLDGVVALLVLAGIVPSFSWYSNRALEVQECGTCAVVQ